MLCVTFFKVFWFISVLAVGLGFKLQDDLLSIGGVRPNYMSPERYHQIQTINFQEALYDEKERMKPEVKSAPRRTKRGVSTGSGDLPAQIPQGFYKKDSLLIEKLETVTLDPNMADVTADLLRFGNYVDGDTVTKMRFSVTEVSDSEVSIKVELLENSVWTEVAATNSEESLSNYIDFSNIPGAKITDIALGNNPKSAFNFLCVTVDYKLPYPRNVSDGVHDLQVNAPQEIPEMAKSCLFRFEVTDSGYTLNKLLFLGKTVLDTSEAKDCEFATWDGKLMLFIAQTDNDQTDQPIQRFRIYHQSRADTEEFEPMVSQNEDYITFQSVRVIHFVIHDRSCAFFVNSWLGVTTSPVYCYSYETRTYTMRQNIRTFGAVDAAFISVDDAYPINSQFFLIVCNQKEIFNGVTSSVGPTIFKYTNTRSYSRFTPFQTLPEIQDCKSVTTFKVVEPPVASDPDLSQFKTSKMKHFVMFSEGNGKTMAYQYNGYRFVKAFEETILASDGRPTVDVIDLSTAASPDPHYITKTGSLHQFYKPEFTAENFYELGSASRTMLQYCHEKGGLRFQQQDFEVLHDEYKSAPVREDLGTEISLSDVTFGSDSSVHIREACVEKSTDCPMKLDVEGLQLLDDNYPSLVAALANDVQNASDYVSSLKERVESPIFARADADNIFVGPLKLINVTGTELSGGRLELTPEFSILKSSNTEINTTDFFANMLIIAGPNANPQGYVIQSPTEFTNIIISGIYDIHNLNGVDIQNYANASDVEPIEITETLTFTTGSTFNGAMTAETVNDETFSDSTVLLRNGDQQLASLNFDNMLTVENIEVSEINGIGLDIVDRALTISDTMFIQFNLTVDNLEINGPVGARVFARDVDDSYVEVDFEDLVGNHMRKSLNNLVEVKHSYSEAVLEKVVTETTVNGANFPEDFVNIETGTVTFQGTMEIPDAQFDGTLTVSQTLVSKDTGYSLDIINGTILPLVPRDSEELIVISAIKTVAEITLNKNATVRSHVQGFDLEEEIICLEAGQKNFTTTITVDEAFVNGEVQVELLVLEEGILTTNCDTECVANNLTHLTIHGVELTAVEIRNVQLTFDEIEFENNVNVASIQSVDPENHIVTLDGTEVRQLLDVTFTERVSFAKNVAQVAEATVSACKECPVGPDRMLCKEEFCSLSEGTSPCEKINGECLIKEGVKNETLCAEVMTESLEYIWHNSLKIHGETDLSRGIIFQGGFKTKILEVRSSDCLFNGVSCLNMATTNNAEQFTGTNEIFGSIHLNGNVNIEDLTVGGLVDSVDISFVYQDSLFIDAEPQNVSNVMFNTFAVKEFISNGRTIGMTSAEDLASRSNNVINMLGATAMLGTLAFEPNITAKNVQVDIFNNANMMNFFGNKITDESNQIITGNITVSNDLQFFKSVSSGSENSLVNGLDLPYLDEHTVRIMGDNIEFNDVELNECAVNHAQGLIVINKFLGVVIPDDVIKCDDTVIQITGKKTLTNNYVNISRDLMLDGVQWQSDSSSTSIDTDNMISFMDDDTLDKVKFNAQVSFENEPMITNLNGENLILLVGSIWMRNRQTDINFNITFENMIATGAVTMAEGNVKINGIDLTDFNNYVSLTLDQDLMLNATFQGGLNIQTTLKCITLTLDDETVEKAIIFGDVNLKIKELNDNAVFLVGRNIDVPRLFIIDEAEFDEIELADDILSNGIDISNSALTYTEGDIKSFEIPVTINSDVDLDELTPAEALRFPTALPQTETFTGVVLADNIIAVVVDDMLANAVYNDNNDTVIKSLKEFSAEISMAKLTTIHSINGVIVGSCISPFILLSKPCFGSESQEISGIYILTNDVVARQISLDFLNGENLDAISEDFVYKRAADMLTFTGYNTFTASLELAGSSEFQGNVFGEDVTSLRSRELQPVDMQYESMQDFPDLTSLVEHIKQEAEHIMPQFLYTSLIEWQEDSDLPGWFKSTMTPDNDFLLKFVGVEKNSDGSLSLKLFSLPTDLAQRGRTKLNSVTTEPAWITNTDLLDILSIPVDDKMILVVKGMAVQESTGGHLDVLQVTAGPDGFDVSVIQEDYVDVDVLSFASVMVQDQKCVLLCKGGLGAEVACLNPNSILETFQTLPVSECYSVSTTPSVGAHNVNTTSFLAVYTGVFGSGLTIFKLAESNLFEVAQVIQTTPNAITNIFGFKEIILEDSEKIVLTLFPANGATDLHIFHFDTTSQTFEAFDTLRGAEVRSVGFIQDSDQVSLHVLSSDEDGQKLDTYAYRNFAKFSGNDPVESVRLARVGHAQVSIDNNGQKFVVTSGQERSERALAHLYVYQDQDVSEIRETFAEKSNLPPEFVTLDCNSMLAANLRRLYDDGNYDFDAIGELFLRVMPRRHIHYSPQDFASPVQETLADPDFQQILEKSAPNAVANMYAYVDGVRTPADQTYVGSLLLYKGTDSILYVYGQIKADDFVSYRAITFWTSCDDNATEIASSIFSGENEEPRVHLDPDQETVRQCSLLHDVDRDFCDDLETIDNKENAGAIVLHQNEMSNSTRYACGYLKLPATAKIQFYRDHNDESSIHFDPFIDFML